MASYASPLINCYTEIYDRDPFKCYILHSSCFVNRKASMIVAVYIILLLTTATFCYRDNSRPNICRTETCFETSRNILHSMNRQVSGCDDFYEHACGGWIRKNARPRFANAWGHIEILRQKVTEDLRNILQESIRSADTVAERKVKMLYTSCIDTDAMDQAGITVIDSIIHKSGKWPMIEPEPGPDVQQRTWESVHIYYSRLTGIGGLVNIQVISNRITNNIPTISLHKPATVYGLYSSISHDKMKHYKQFVRQVALAFIQRKMSNVTRASVEKDINDVIEFRNRLQGVVRHYSRRETDEDGLTTIEALQNFTNNETGQLTNISWLPLIKDCFPHNVANLIDSSERVFIQKKQYMKSLISLLKTTPCRTIVNHIQLYFVETHLKYTDSRMRTMAEYLDMMIEGPQYHTDRCLTCIKTNQMKHVLSNMYVKKHFSRASKEYLIDMTKNLKHVLADHIGQSQWLDEETKLEAVRKVERMQIQIGYPDWYEDNKQLRNYYKGQKVSTNYLQNIVSYMGNEYRIELSRLRNVETRQTYEIYPIDVSALYIFEKNAIIVNAAYLQWPFYTVGGPDAVNYATVGSTIGHEIAHAFDTTGSLYNSIGKRVNWWSKQSSAIYNNKIDCVNKMYNNYTAPEVEPPLQMENAVLTVDENIADIIGLKVAYHAFQRSISNTPKELVETTLGFDWSRINELFFLSYASVFCEVLNVDRIERMMHSNVHNFPRFRVNGPISLMPEFKETFSCSAASPMNPQETCAFWDF